MKLKILALGIVVMLVATMAGCTQDGDYLTSGTLSNIIDSLGGENVVIKIPLKVSIDMDADKKEDYIETDRGNYYCTNYSAIYKATLQPLSEEDTTKSTTSTAPEPFYASDNFIIEAKDGFVPQLLRIGESDQGVFSGDLPDNLGTLISGVGSLNNWKDMFSGLTDYSQIDSVVTGNRGIADETIGYKMDTFFMNLQGQAQYQADRVHVIELPLHVLTTFKDPDGNVLHISEMQTILQVPVKGPTELDGVDDESIFYPELKYVSPLGWLDRAIMDIEVLGTESTGDDWSYVSEKEEISWAERYILRPLHKWIADGIATVTFGTVTIPSPLSDDDRPRSHHKLMDGYGPGAVFDELAKVMENEVGFGLRNYVYTLIPGGESASPGSDGAGACGTLLIFPIIGLFIAVGTKKEKRKD